jgi:pimeloyl-ACP methyl ester carboxylesterase
MAFLTHAGVSLRYDRAGTGPAVLLIHPWSGNRTFWERQVQALRDRHTVVAVDLRGHGESSHPRTGYSIGGLAADLEHLVRGLGVPRLAVVGWSMGGVVAQELALRLGDRVTALALVSTTAGGAGDPGRAAEMKAAIDNDFRSAVREIAKSVFKDGADAPLYPWFVAQAQKTPPHVAAACFDALVKADLRKRLKELKAPTAVLHGRHDALTPLSQAESLAKSIKGAKLIVFDASGHAPPLEEPDAFNAALADLLAPFSIRGGLSVPSAPSGPARPTTSR